VDTIKKAVALRAKKKPETVSQFFILPQAPGEMTQT